MCIELLVAPLQDNPAACKIFLFFSFLLLYSCKSALWNSLNISGMGTYDIYFYYWNDRRSGDGSDHYLSYGARGLNSILSILPGIARNFLGLV